jgi:hypothetical protein
MTLLNATPAASTSPAAQYDYLLLRRTLFGNVAFSLASGVAVLLFSGPIAEFMGIAAPALLLVIGGGLLAFALMVFQTARQVPLNRARATLILIADVLWVVGTAVILVTDLFALTDGGKVVSLVVALIVADFAVFEWIGLRRGQRGR